MEENMFRSLLCIGIVTMFLVGCGPSKPTELTGEQIAEEKEKVVQVIKDYNKAFEDKKFESIVRTLSDDVVFFGSDSSEVIKSLSDFKQSILDQWNTYDIKYGEIYDKLIVMDNTGTLASIIYGTPATVKVKGSDSTLHYFFRVSRTLKKQDGRWMIASGIIGITQQVPVAKK